MVTARVRCFPTEDPEKVKRALLNIFPDALVEDYEGGYIARSGTLGRFKQLVRNQRILDSTRKMLLKGVSEGETSFRLNKQVAFIAKVSFAEERVPLGSIEVCIESDDLPKLVDEVAPVTVNGEEVRQ